MPNHVMNKIKLINAVDYSNVVERCCTVNEDGHTVFDFNRLVPCPESLRIESGTVTDNALYAYCLLNGYKCPLKRWYIDIAKERIGVTSEAANEWLSKQNIDVLSIGKTAYDNYRKFGTTTWYDWCCSHWGTKWNAYGCNFDYDNKVITFQTAWSAPDPVIYAMHSFLQNVEFEWFYADEDRGYNTGRYYTEDGNLCFDDIENNSNEAASAYVECWGKSDCVGKDDNGNYVLYDCDSCPNKDKC